MIFGLIKLCLLILFIYFLLMVIRPYNVPLIGLIDFLLKFLVWILIMSVIALFVLFAIGLLILL